VCLEEGEKSQEKENKQETNISYCIQYESKSHGSSVGVTTGHGLEDRGIGV
jgi:hypothetical protein